MSECRDQRYPGMLHAYELGLLDDDNRRELELHMMDCDACRLDVGRLVDVMHLMRTDSDIRHYIERLAEVETAATSTRPAAKRARIAVRLVPITLITLIIIFILTLQPWRIEIQPTREAVAVSNRLAVMYFDNVQDPSDSSLLGDILTNLLITDIAESQYVQVVSSQRLCDILRALGHGGTKRVNRAIATEVAKKAQARWMLLGAILRSEPQVTVTAQLVDVESGNIIASQRVIGEPYESVFSLIDKLSHEVKNDLPLPSAAQVESDRPVADVTTHSREAYRHYVAGLDYLNKYYYDEAAESFKKALMFDSTFAMAYFQLSYLETGRYLNKSLEYIDRVNPKDRHYLYSRGKSALGDFAGALAELETIVSQYPDEKEAWAGMGELNFTHRHHTQALYCFGRTLELDPYHKPALNLTAYIHALAGRLDEAINVNDRYIKIAPEEANPYDTRGDIYAFFGDTDRAVENYRHALQIKPDLGYTLMKLASMHLFARDYEQAERYFRLAISTVDENTRPAIEYFFAFIPQYQGRFEETLQMLDSGITRQRDAYDLEVYAVYRMLKSNIYAEQGRWPEAIAEVEATARIPRIFSDWESNMRYLTEVSLFKQKGMLLALAGDTAGAKSQLEAFGQVIPENLNVLSHHRFLQGVIELSAGNPLQAVSYLKQATGDSAFSFSEQYMLGMAFLEADLPDSAAAQFEKCLRFYNEWRAYWGIWAVKAYYYLGLACEKAGNIGKAMANYEEFLSIWKDADPGRPEIEDAKARLARLKKP